MNNTMPRAILCVLSVGLLTLSSNGQAERESVPPAEPISITMTADRWQTKENAEFLRQLGFFHGLMRLNSGNAVLKGVTFGDGTIEFDVNTIGRGAPGIAFRQRDDDNFAPLSEARSQLPGVPGLHPVRARDAWGPT